MAAGAWAQPTEGLDADDLKKLTAFRDYCRELGTDVEERVHSAEIAFAVKRVFASAYIKSHYLEIGIDLTRKVSDPKPRATVASTTTRTLHRYSLRELSAFDASIRKLLREAYDEAAAAAAV